MTPDTRKQSPVELVKELYDAYQEKTDGQFHNTLWQILINECRDVLAHNSCFVLLYGRPNNVGIADRDQVWIHAHNFRLQT